jgi:hypothetical protein
MKENHGRWMRRVLGDPAASQVVATSTTPTNDALLAKIARDLAAAEEHLAALAPYTPHAALYAQEVRQLRQRIVAVSGPGPASPGGPGHRR